MGAGATRQSISGAVSGQPYCHNNIGGIGGTESMPSNVNGAMAQGQANSGFQGLNAVFSFVGSPLTQHGWCVGVLAGVAVLLAAFAYRRAVAGPFWSEEQMDALTAVDGHSE